MICLFPFFELKETQNLRLYIFISPRLNTQSLNSKLSTLNLIILSPLHAGALQLFLQGEHKGDFGSHIRVEAHA